MKYGILFVVLLFFTFGIYTFVQKIHPTQYTIYPTTNKSVTKTAQTTSSGKVPSIPLKLPDGYTIHEFASNLGSPRDLVFSPEGVLLVSNPGKNEVYALPDTNNDGVADENKVIIANEPHVHGLAFYQNSLFVADTTKVVSYTWNKASLTATKQKTIATLPANSDHNNRTLAIDTNGKMYITVGSTCDVCTESPQTGGSIWQTDVTGSKPVIFASGLRNAPFIVFNPETNQLWGTEMGRDNLGDSNPPDEINIIENGKNYGWPNCYGKQILDTNFVKNKTTNCSSTTSPIFEIPAHSAPLGLAFITSAQFPSSWQNDLFVSYHGSWNRSTPTGYKVVHMKVTGNSITGVEDFLTGFAPSKTPNTPGNLVNTAAGRPVDLVFDKGGNLYLSDDKAGVVYIIQKN